MATSSPLEYSIPGSERSDKMYIVRSAKLPKNNKDRETEIGRHGRSSVVGNFETEDIAIILIGTAQTFWMRFISF